MRILLILFAGFFAAPVPAQMAPPHSPPSILQQALASARQLQLAQHPQWLALLHYKNEVWTPRIVSQADDAAFFLAASGKVDATAELMADIRGFLQAAHSMHAQCRFPARWHWLKQQLALTNDHDVPCPEFERWAQAIPVDSLTLVFPAMTLSSPGSSFGHTFLRFDNAKSPLQSRSLNYAASYKKTDSLPKYVYNGLFGGYHGVFVLRRYFETEHEYRDMEQRDVREYRLDYTPAEIRQLIRHLWEVKDINFDYYFFSENCSYRLLALLDVLRAESTLTTGNHFPLYAIPVDTVRALEDAGTIVQRHFRASLASRIRASLAAMPPAERQQVMQLVNGRMLPGETDAIARLPRQAAVLDTAYAILQFNGRQDGWQAQAILALRDELDIAPATIQAPPVSPEQGHRTARWLIGAGQRESRASLRLQIRPAFHDLLDAPGGYVSGAAINVFQTELRVYDDAGGQRLALQQLRFVSMQSLAARHDWYQPFSWLLDIKLQNQPAAAFAQTDDFVSLQTRVGGGLAYDVGNSDRHKTYLLAVADWHVADELQSGYSMLAGLQLGWLMYTESGQLGLQMEALRDVAGAASSQDTLMLTLQFNLQPDSAIRLAYRQSLYLQGNDGEWSLNWLRYF